jgi:Fe-S-cluster-containing dehydrogenase component/anaerobic selenocysteine-containing dehydrogenase
MTAHDDDLTRRSFLKALGASLALAGLDGCTRIPAEKILPYVNQPADFTPGVPVHYATSMVLDGYATGLVVEAHEGRPTKIEGNPDHPASLGAAGVLEQASLLQLYDPDRARGVRKGRSRSSWEGFVAAMSPAGLKQRVGARGERLAILLEPTSSPVIGDLLTTLRARYPAISVYYYAPLVSESAAGAVATGAGAASVIPHYDVAAADVILAVESDFLAEGPFNLPYARAFAERRKAPRGGMNRLYAIESRVTVTGGAADHRLRLRPSAIEGALEQLLGHVAAVRGGSNAVGATAGSSAWLAEVARDLSGHAGSSLVIAGERSSSRTHALVAAINDALGNTGRTVWHTPSPLLGAGQPAATLAALAGEMRANHVDTLVCIGGNPSYASPGSLAFSQLVRAVANSAYVGLYENETARDCQWFVPAAHYLEAWGDARAYDGTLSIVQPLVQPLHGGRSAIEVLAALAGEPTADPLTLLRASWRRTGAATDDDAWAAALQRGFVAGTQLPRVTAVVRRELLGAATTPRLETAGNASMDVVIAPDARVRDGAFSNNAWLQELPDPITKLTWDNAGLVSPGTATRLGVETGDRLLVERSGARLEMPALIVPGQADDTLVLHLGYGRTGAEAVARGVGSNVYPWWPALGGFALANVTVRRATDGARHDFAITQTHWTMEGRDQARSETLASYRESATSRTEPESRRRALTVYDPQQRLESAHQWAMTIDLGTCIGCSACVVACQSENNIPVVGRDDVANSREMHWLRIDRYQMGSAADPDVVTQPMLCQHCENAPCEYVCPVGATVHSPDGLNEMVYNRCVGTRFCSNNCPYKVRRFNWFDYNARLSETEQMGKNPDVTVRERGVMEKCTFCVQRIREAEIDAELAGRPLRGDEVKTACQQTCPTNAIVFGSLTERDSEMVRRRSEPRAYDVLPELGTEPRVKYLARIRNVNPAMERET